MGSFKFPVRTQDEKDSQDLIYEFVVDENGCPQKLGDGTFGAVFKTIFSGSKKSAVKLFYPTNEESVTRQRNDREMRAGREVRQNLERQGLGALESNLVLADGWTTKFTTSEAYESLNTAFNNLGIAVSPHALVMPYYECTLKDLLETGAPAGRLVSGEIVTEPGAPAYEILSGMELPERERNIAAIVGQIVSGLWALHAADLFHRDIKPANVMMRVVGASVQVSLGDFGFLDELPEKNGSGGYGGALPLGTRHYRSPEQKDYFDLCDVKVTTSDHDSGQHLLLETKDRKFVDTLIEEGDIAEFSKDKHSAAQLQTGYQVKAVNHDGNKSRIILDNHRKASFVDEKTQVLFYKKPSRRTDLFGIGALIFDMLTLGKSPECFYDYLRPFDRSSSNDGGNSVNTIEEKYRAAVNANTTSADLAPILKQVRDSVFGQYPSPEIMTVMLRCMMSRSFGSYFYDAAQHSPTMFFKKILEDISRLPSLRIGELPSGVSDAPPPFTTTNPLWSGASTAGPRTETGKSFVDGMVKAYDRVPGKRRFVAGARRLAQICEVIGYISGRKDFYVDIGPNNLQLEKDDIDVHQILATYRNEEQYLSAVLTGAAWNLEGSGAKNSLVPIYMRFNIRAIRFRIEEISDDSKCIHIKAWYTESSPIWRGCTKGDFLRVSDLSGHSGLFAIQEMGTVGALVDIKAESVKLGDGFSISMAGDYPEGLAIRRLEPVRCYLSMLATYLHHLFFVDNCTDSGVIPEESWNYLKQIFRGRVSDSEPGVAKVDNGNWWPVVRSRRRPSYEQVGQDIAEFYLKLMRRSESREDLNGIALIGEMKREVDLILDRIAIFIGYESRHDMLLSRYETSEFEQKEESESFEGKGLSYFLNKIIQ